jgi:hypothetical protein
VSAVEKLNVNNDANGWEYENENRNAVNSFTSNLNQFSIMSNHMLNVAIWFTLPVTRNSSWITSQSGRLFIMVNSRTNIMPNKLNIMLKCLSNLTPKFLPEVN